MPKFLSSTVYLTLPLAIFGCLITLTAEAQITPDGTTSTTVNQAGNDFTIEQGSRVGDNLFHSFDEFSVPTLGSAFFNNASDIANVFSRVTGSNISTIDGLLSANGTANFFLINPNGIIFGENARLNLGGSFFASTADSLLFRGNTEFSASNPQAPPLLEVSIPIGINFRDNPGDIVNRSYRINSVYTNFDDFLIGLEVAPGENLTLVGGNINFKLGQATAKGGHIQLGGLSAAGTVGINDDGSLSFPEDVAKADINFSNFANVDVSGTDGGNITINARNLNLDVISTMRAGITADSISPEAQAGDITISATDNITIDNSAIRNQVNSGAEGNGGDINITTGSLNVTNGGQIDAQTFSQGNAGSINIIATDTITFDGEDSSGNASWASTSVNTFGEGKGGDINIITNSLNLTNGGLVSASILGQGNAGSVNITAKDTINIDGETSNGFGSGAISLVDPGAVGDGGSVTITTGNLNLTNGGRVSAITLSKGNAGSVKITASDTINIDGETLDGSPNSGVFSQVTSAAEGNGGDINIITGSLNVTNGGQIDAQTFSQGNAGSINIIATDTITFDGEDSSGNASWASTSVNTFGEGKGGDINIITNSLNLTNGGLVSASILGQGNAGSVKIIANDTITIDGETSSGFGSGAISLVETEAVGDAGSVTINTGNLNLTNGGRVSTITLGQGNAGSVNITANNTVNIDGETSDGSPNSGAFSTSSSGAVGNAGGVAINTESLTITNGGIVSTSTFGQGNAGAINITASDTIDIDGEGSDANVSQVISFVSSNAVGNSGGITITTSSLSLTNGGQVDSSTRGQGNAGDINITATDAVTFDGEGGFLGIFQSGAYSDVGSNAVGNSGGVTINTSSLSLTNGGRVDSSTFGQGNAGAINIIARDIVSIDGEGSLGIFNSGTYSDVRSNAVGNSGGVTITTGSLSLTNGGEISASTSGQGNAGDIKITARDIVSIDGEGSLGLSSIIRSTVVDRLGVFKAGTGKPGNIEIQANSLSLSNQARIEATTQSKTGENANINLQLTEDLIFFDNSLISASAFEEADGGNINIDADFIIAFPNQNNDIVANASQGKGGNIDIDALSLFGIEERTSNNITNDINASSELGLQGNISINTPEIDPTSGLVELPEAVADATDQISQNICEQGRESEFIITGKGGLPPNPHETLNSDEEQVDLVDLVQPGPLPRQTVGANGIRPNNPRPEKSTSELVPARGWIFNDKGEVTLTSYKTANTEIRQSQPKNLPTCSNGI